MAEIRTTPGRPAAETPSGRTAKNIAYGLIGTYALALACIGGVAAWRDSEIWIDLFKSGFLILGGALTTVIGYYFGSRGVQDAEANALRANERASSAELLLDQVRAAPTTREDPSLEEGMFLPEEYQEPE